MDKQREQFKKISKITERLFRLIVHGNRIVRLLVEKKIKLKNWEYSL